MSGYWRNAEATAAALQGGWFRTGDVGHLDQQGDLWIDARKDDLIKSGGERIYPAELEDLLRRAPGVADVAIVGRPDPTWGEVPVAVVVAAGRGPSRAHRFAQLSREPRRTLQAPQRRAVRRRAAHERARQGPALPPARFGPRRQLTS